MALLIALNNNHSLSVKLSSKILQERKKKLQDMKGILPIIKSVQTKTVLWVIFIGVNSYILILYLYDNNQSFSKYQVNNVTEYFIRVNGVIIMKIMHTHIIYTAEKCHFFWRYSIVIFSVVRNILI